MARLAKKLEKRYLPIIHRRLSPTFLQPLALLVVFTEPSAAVIASQSWARAGQQKLSLTRRADSLGRAGRLHLAQQLLPSNLTRREKRGVWNKHTFYFILSWQTTSFCCRVGQTAALCQHQKLSPTPLFPCSTAARAAAASAPPQMAYQKTLPFRKVSDDMDRRATQHGESSVAEGVFDCIAT